MYLTDMIFPAGGFIRSTLLPTDATSHSQEYCRKEKFKHGRSGLKPCVRQTEHSISNRLGPYVRENARLCRLFEQHPIERLEWLPKEAGKSTERSQKEKEVFTGRIQALSIIEVFRGKDTCSK
jgi:hypothetical protein